MFTMLLILYDVITLPLAPFEYRTDADRALEWIATLEDTFNPDEP